MNIVKTTAPISIENLKHYFTDKSTFYIIDYKNSSIKGAKLLTYLSNLDIPCDINFEGCSKEECYDMVKDYMKTAMIVNIKSLELTTISVLMQFKGITEKIDNEFIEENKDIIKHWITRIDSLTLYNMSMVGTEQSVFKDYINSFEVDETNTLIGVNFISLIKHPEMYELYTVIDKRAIKNYTKYFKDYMFKGKSLYSYWANENNPMFLLTYGITSGTIKADEYNELKTQSIKELENVTSIR